MDRRGRQARGRVLDAGALIAIDRGDRLARVFLGRKNPIFIVPAPVLAQVWRDGTRQARLASVIGSRRTIIEAFDEHLAKAAGILLGRTGTADVADASVVLAARRYEALVVTSDAADIRRLDPDLPIAEV